MKCTLTHIDPHTHTDAGINHIQSDYVVYNLTRKMVRSVGQSLRQIFWMAPEMLFGGSHLKTFALLANFNIKSIILSVHTIDQSTDLHHIPTYLMVSVCCLEYYIFDCHRCISLSCILYACRGASVLSAIFVFVFPSSFYL